MAAKKKKTKRKPAKKAVRKVKLSSRTASRKKKKAAKRPSKAAKIKKKGPPVIGLVTHYFPHVNAAVIKVKRPLEVGQTIQISGHTTHFTQRVDSMQIDHVPVERAKKGDEIGLEVTARVREHDIVTLA